MENASFTRSRPFYSNSGIAYMFSICDRIFQRGNEKTSKLFEDIVFAYNTFIIVNITINLVTFSDIGLMEGIPIDFYMRTHLPAWLYHFILLELHVRKSIYLFCGSFARFVNTLSEQKC